MAFKQLFDTFYFEKTKKRLLRNIVINESGCWIWKKATNQKYGVMYFKRKQTYSHRVSYEIFKGKNPGKLLVCHRCDVPLCCNPSHLFLGTDKQNMQDCRRKGRGIFGSRCTNSKLKPEDVIEIRKLLEKGMSQSKIAKKFGIAQTGVSGIKIGKYWKHL